MVFPQGGPPSRCPQPSNVVVDTEAVRVLDRSQYHVCVGCPHAVPLFGDDLFEILNGVRKSRFLCLDGLIWIKWSKILLILSWYCSASATFCAPASGHSSSSSSTNSTTGSALSVIDCRCSGFEPKEGGNLVGHSKTRFKLMVLVGTAAYIGPAPHLDIVPW